MPAIFLSMLSRAVPTFSGLLHKVEILYRGGEAASGQSDDEVVELKLEKNGADR